jgi:hypothetical protein
MSAGAFPHPLRRFLAQLNELRFGDAPDMAEVGRLLLELAAPTTCTTMATSGAAVQALTRSSCWVMTCSCSSARNTTRTGAGGAGLPPVIQVGRTADQPGSRRVPLL